LDDLIVVGIGGGREKCRLKKILNELIEMRMGRKKQTQELMDKRAGTFNLKDNTL
jgi:hypothetical protein